jgi:ppGpp synthetase/RelA/SpoT-type nucleotidyltranferase
MSDVTPAVWGERYRESRGIYESLALRLQNLLKEILHAADIDVAQIEARTKRVDSFVEKIQRKDGRYANPMTEMTDLIGLRVLVYYREDVDEVCDVLKQEFSIDRDNSVDKSAALDVDRFGYLSVHYVATLSGTRGKLREWKAFHEIKFEIQVRTVLQHAWAAVNHKLDYKSANAAPARLRRKLFQLSALFELADEQFSLIHRDSLEIAAEYKNKVSGGNFDLPLDVLSLRAYLERHPQMNATRELLAGSGFRIGLEDDPPKVRDYYLDTSVRALNAIGITCLSDLDEAIREDLPKAIDYAAKDVAARIEPVIVALLSVARGIKDRQAFEEVYSPQTWERYEQTRESFVRATQAGLPSIAR